jgi:hypothetical protein
LYFIGPIQPANEPIVTTNKELEPIMGGTKLTIVSYTLFSPTKPMEVHVISNFKVEVLEELAT